MESIEQMINRLCPKGMEQMKIGDICEILRGKRLTKKEPLHSCKDSRLVLYERKGYVSHIRLIFNCFITAELP